MASNVMYEDVYVTWTWVGDNEALQGFNIALCAQGQLPFQVTTAFAKISDPTQRQHIFSNVVVPGVAYQVYVQALYYGADSDWSLAGSDLVIADTDGSTLAKKATVDIAATTATVDSNGNLITPSGAGPNVDNSKQQVGGRNLLLGSKDFSTSWVSNNAIIDSSTYNGNSVYKVTIDWAYFYQVYTLTPGKTYTFSCVAKASSAGPYIYATVDGDHWTQNQTLLTTTYQTYKYTFTASGTAVGIRWECNSLSGTGKTVYITSPKLEEGNIATTWTPAPEDTPIALSQNVNTTTINSALAITNYLDITNAGAKINIGRYLDDTAFNIAYSNKGIAIGKDINNNPNALFYTDANNYLKYSSSGLTIRGSLNADDITSGSGIAGLNICAGTIATYGTYITANNTSSTLFIKDPTIFPVPSGGEYKLAQLAVHGLGVIAYSGVDTVSKTLSGCFKVLYRGTALGSSGSGFASESWLWGGANLSNSAHWTQIILVNDIVYNIDTKASTFVTAISSDDTLTTNSNIFPNTSLTYKYVIFRPMTANSYTPGTAIIPMLKSLVLDRNINELICYDDAGAGVEQIGKIGVNTGSLVITTPGGTQVSQVCAQFGSTTYGNTSVGLVGYTGTGIGIIGTANKDGIGILGQALGYNAVAVYGNSYAGNGMKAWTYSGTGSISSSVSGAGIFGTSTSSYGIMGSSTSSYSFYSSGGTVGHAGGSGASYGPFTGAHDALIKLGSQSEYEIGDIVIDKEILFHGSVSDTLSLITTSKSKNDPAVLGVVALISDPNTESCNIPSAVALTSDDVLKYSEYDHLIINSLGEGQINVCKENGNIKIGDYITSSSTAGKGMRQDDDLMHNYTVAKAREDCIWSDNEDDIRMIACTYHCG